jgi:murein DD-endopeptidase MepM/ murein hydrolase activator NlpD
VLFDSKKAPALTYAFHGTEAAEIRIRVIDAGTGRAVHSWSAPARRPDTRYTRGWNGTDDGGRAVPSGRYRFRFGPAGTGIRWPAGSLVIRDNIYPIDGPHSARGAIGEFGAPRSGGRTHEGFDELADCGTPLIAARGGRVAKAGFDPVLFGWFVLIDGRKTKRDYFYSHLRDRPLVAKKERVRTGERIGRVGQTGNARSTPCHLHFELRTPEGPIDPKPALSLWDRWS